MFFVLSKLLVFLIRPLTWMLVLLTLALWAKGPRWRRGSLIALMVVFLVFTNRWLSNTMVGWWEAETFTARELAEPYDIGILLGGYTTRRVEPSDDRQNFTERANRFLNALELYKKGKFNVLLLSGGSGAIFPDSSLTEAYVMEGYLQALGLPDSTLLLEGASRNTYENALFSKKLIEEQAPGARCLLLTSAWHMPRALGCFRKVGLPVTPYSVDHLYESPGPGLDWYLLPQSKSLYIWDLLIKEWVGYMAYRLNGYL